MSGEPLDRLRDVLPPHYSVVREIGRGGMATVYLADDLKHHRKVAIKVLAPGLGEAVGVERFEREIDTVAALRHPHILPLHDSGRGAGLMYFVMPFVQEGTLRDRLLREGPLPVEEALRLACEVAEALAYAHRQGVVHRDIKPENIVLESGHAVVSDFGIAVLVEGVAEERITRSGHSPGTPEYMSPEQAEGGGRADPRTDIYSLGCVLYEMLAGDPPFTGSSKHAILARKLSDPVLPLRTVRSGLPEVVERITLKTLERVPADRPQSAAELAESLSRLESEVRSASARAAGLGPDLDGGRPAIRLAATAAVYTGGGLLLLAGIGVLCTRVFDYKVQMPPMYKPSRTDFIVVGVEALIPFLVYALATLGVGFIVTRYLFPLTKRVTTSVTRGSGGGTRRWRTLAGVWPSRSFADLFLVAMVGVSLLVLWPFREIYFTLAEPGSESLACGSRTLHNLHYATMPALIVVLWGARRGLFRWLRRRRPGEDGWEIARWASAGWLVVLVVITTLPWRVLWDAYYERALIEGERAYVIGESDGEMLAYTPTTHSVRVFDANGVAVERLGIFGYIFEEPAVFQSPHPRCMSLWEPAP